MLDRARVSLLAFVVALATAGPAWAGPRDFVLCMGGFLGTTEQAAPVLEGLFRHLEKTLGWPEKSISGSYHPDAAEGLAAIKSVQPGFALVTHEMYAAQRGPMKMQLIGGMRLADGALSRYHVVTKATGGPATLAELAGKTIASPHLAEVRFADRVIFGGGLSLGHGGAKAVDVRAPLSALRKVARGEVDAAVVDEPVIRQLSKLPIGAELRVVHSSDELPPLPVVAFPRASSADRQAMAKALLGLCSQGDGAALCRSLRLQGVEAVRDATYAPLLAKLR